MADRHLSIQQKALQLLCFETEQSPSPQVAPERSSATPLSILQPKFCKQRFTVVSILGGALCVVEAARVNKTTDESS